MASSGSGMQAKIQQAAGQMQMMLLQQLQEEAVSVCFKKCVPTAASGGVLDFSQQTCLQACNGAYMSTFQADAVQQAALKAQQQGSGDDGRMGGF